MESKHTTPEQASPSPYTEQYRGFALTLEWHPGGAVRAIATGPVVWLTPFGASWLTQLEQIRQLVDRYLRCLAWCHAGANPFATGAVERPSWFGVPPAVES